MAQLLFTCGDGRIAYSTTGASQLLYHKVDLRNDVSRRSAYVKVACMAKDQESGATQSIMGSSTPHN